MTRSFVFLVIVGCLLVMSGCTTPSKSSKLEYLVGEGSSTVTEKNILDDLARTVYVKKKRQLSQIEKGRDQTDKDSAVSSTSTWLRIYPYTRPLIATRLEKNIREKGFKEKWDDQRIEAEVKNQITSESNRLVLDKQCFAVEINTPDPGAIKLEYWHGALKQNGQEQKLTFTKGTGFVQIMTTTYINRGTGYGSSTESQQYFYYADACGTKAIQLAEAFSLSIEPRYEAELLPIQLDWLAPKASKPAAK